MGHQARENCLHYATPGIAAADAMSEKGTWLARDAIASSITFAFACTDSCAFARRGQKALMCLGPFVYRCVCVCVSLPELERFDSSQHMIKFLNATRFVACLPRAYGVRFVADA